MTRTITALYDSRDEAEAARAQLSILGVGSDQVQITAQDSHGSSADHGGEGGGFLKALKNFFMADEDRHAYGEGVRRGGYLLTARVDENRADEVCNALDSSGAVDFDERQAQWRSEGWSGGDSDLTTSRAGSAGGYMGDAAGYSAAGATELGGGLGDHNATSPAYDEQLRPGRRDMDRGGSRVRAYIEDTSWRDNASGGHGGESTSHRGLAERASFGGADEDHSIAMDPDGASVQETEEERRVRLSRLSPGEPRGM